MSTKKTFSTLPQTKQHFEILDGLRGVAALAVVTFHFMELAIRALGRVILFPFTNGSDGGDILGNGDL